MDNLHGYETFMSLHIICEAYLSMKSNSLMCFESNYLFCVGYKILFNILNQFIHYLLYICCSQLILNTNRVWP